MTSKVHNFAHKASFPPSPHQAMGAFLITRKDTIIIAMLVNIALLVVLFATATKKHEPILVEKKDVVVCVTEPYVTAVETPPKMQALDEIDAILERFTHAKHEPVKQGSVVKEVRVKEEIVQSAQKPQNVKPQSAKKAPQKTDEAIAEYYVVKSGDNPWTIARKFHINFADLLKLNDLDEEKAKNLKIGQKIRIR